MRAESRLSRSGFTAIELMIVLSIMLILTSIAAPNVYDALRKSRVNLAVAGIEDIAGQARQLAAQTLAPADGLHYGVRIVQPAPGAAAVAEIVYGSSAGDAETALNTDGTPVAQYRFAPSVVIMVDGQPLCSTGDCRLTWFYSYQSGTPLARAGDQAPATVGLPQISISNQWGITASWASPSIPAIAAATGTVPGLGVQSTDGAVRYAMAVYPTGKMVTRELR